MADAGMEEPTFSAVTFADVMMISAAGGSRDAATGIGCAACSGGRNADPSSATAPRRRRWRPDWASMQEIFMGFFSLVRREIPAIGCEGERAIGIGVYNLIHQLAGCHCGTGTHR